MISIMLIPPEATEALQAAGIEATPVEVNGRLLLEVGADRRDTIARLAVRRFESPLSARDLEDLAERLGRALLVVVPRASARARARAEELGVSLISLDRERRSGPSGHIAWGPSDVTPIVADDAPPTSRLPRQRTSWGAMSVRKALLMTAERRQTALSAMTGISQPRVSQVFKELTERGLMRRGQGDASVDVMWKPMMDSWVEDYPGSGGAATYWFGLDPIVEQVRVAATHLAHRGDECLVSGDVAADHIAPWARPVQGLVYVHRAVDLAELGFTPTSAADATLVLAVPEDPAGWRGVTWIRPRREREGEGLSLADPLQVLVDVAGSGGIDADQAQAHLAARLRTLLDVEEENP